MKLIVLFLLIGCLSIANATERDEILRILENSPDGRSLSIDSNQHELKIVSHYIGSTEYSVTWKAKFDGVEVAIRIFTHQDNMDREVNAFRALKATTDPNIEDKGIQKVYYTGQIFNRFPFIVMSLIDDIVGNRWVYQPYSIFKIFLESVKTLRYLQSRKVLHNDIRPETIYLRGDKVFVGRFNSAALRGAINYHGSADFGSRRFWLGQTRTAMDDLESLVFTIWQMAGVHSIYVTGNCAAGKTMSTQNDQQNMNFVLEKCGYFSGFPKAHEALQFICVHEMLLSRSSVPSYKKIIKRLEAALNEIEEMTGQTEFEWLASGASSSSTARV